MPPTPNSKIVGTFALLPVLALAEESIALNRSGSIDALLLSESTAQTQTGAAASTANWADFGFSGQLAQAENIQQETVTETTPKQFNPNKRLCELPNPASKNPLLQQLYADGAFAVSTSVQNRNPLFAWIRTSATDVIFEKPLGTNPSSLEAEVLGRLKGLNLDENELLSLKGVAQKILRAGVSKDGMLLITYFPGVSNYGMIGTFKPETEDLFKLRGLINKGEVIEAYALAVAIAGKTELLTFEQYAGWKPEPLLSMLTRIQTSEGVVLANNGDLSKSNSLAGGAQDPADYASLDSAQAAANPIEARNVLEHLRRGEISNWRKIRENLDKDSAFAAALAQAPLDSIIYMAIQGSPDHVLALIDLDQKAKHPSARAAVLGLDYTALTTQAFDSLSQGAFAMCVRLHELGHPGLNSFFTSLDSSRLAGLQSALDSGDISVRFQLMILAAEPFKNSAAQNIIQSTNSAQILERARTIGAEQINYQRALCYLALDGNKFYQTQLAQDSTLLSLVFENAQKGTREDLIVINNMYAAEIAPGGALLAKIDLKQAASMANSDFNILQIMLNAHAAGNPGALSLIQGVKLDELKSAAERCDYQALNMLFTLSALKHTGASAALNNINPEYYSQKLDEQGPDFENALDAINRLAEAGNSNAQEARANSDLSTVFAKAQAGDVKSFITLRNIADRGTGQAVGVELIRNLKLDSLSSSLPDSLPIAEKVYILHEAIRLSEYSVTIDGETKEFKNKLGREILRKLDATPLATEGSSSEFAINMAILLKIVYANKSADKSLQQVNSEGYATSALDSAQSLNALVSLAPHNKTAQKFLLELPVDSSAINLALQNANLDSLEAMSAIGLHGNRNYQKFFNALDTVNFMPLISRAFGTADSTAKPDYLALRQLLILAGIDQSTYSSFLEGKNSSSYSLLVNFIGTQNPSGFENDKLKKLFHWLDFSKVQNDLERGNLQAFDFLAVMHDAIIGFRIEASGEILKKAALDKTEWTTQIRTDSDAKAAAESLLKQYGNKSAKEAIKAAKEG